MKGMRFFLLLTEIIRGFHGVRTIHSRKKMRSNSLTKYVLPMSKNHWTVWKELFLASHLHLLICNCFLPHPCTYSGLSTHSHPCHVSFFIFCWGLLPIGKIPCEARLQSKDIPKDKKQTLANCYQSWIITIRTQTSKWKWLSQRMEKASVFLVISLWNSAIITHPRWAILCFCPRTCSINSNRASKTA